MHRRVWEFLRKDSSSRRPPPIPDNTVCCLAMLFQVEMEGVNIEEDGSTWKLVRKLRKQKEEFESLVKKEMVGKSASATYLQIV